MDNNAVPVRITEKDLVSGHTPEPDNLNDIIISELRSIDPKCDARLSESVIECVSENLSKGVPFEACCNFLGVPQGTVKRWIKKGKEEICNMTEEQLNAEDPFETLSNYGKFVVRINKAKANAIVEITDIINGKMMEAHNEWLLTWMLERLDPETYNIKYKTNIRQSSNINHGTQNIIQVQFINGLKSRPAEDQKFIADSLDKLKQIYPNEEAIIQNTND